MIFDNKQMFFDGVAASDGLAGAIIPNYAEDKITPVQQNAGLQPYVFAKLPGATADAVFLLETAADAAFTTPIGLGNFTVKAGNTLSARIPVGSLAFYRLTLVSGGTGATVTAGLVVDADIS